MDIGWRGADRPGRLGLGAVDLPRLALADRGRSWTAPPARPPIGVNSSSRPPACVPLRPCPRRARGVPGVPPPRLGSGGGAL